MADCSFPKQSRLLSAEDFKAVFDNARYKVSNRHFLFLAIDNDRSEPRLGLVVAKKHVAKAVGRNRLKRIIRERFRHNKALLGGLDVVVLVRKDVNNLERSQVARTLDTLLNDLSAKFKQRS